MILRISVPPGGEADEDDARFPPPDVVLEMVADVPAGAYGRKKRWEPTCLPGNHYRADEEGTDHAGKSMRSLP